MAVYNPKSLKAEEFINDQEILDTLAYAEANKNNIELIDSILEKARPKRDGNGLHCSGLSHREASVLLACEIPEKVEEMYKLANEIKHDFYGNRIVMFAPLYLSNYCVNGCVYCPYHLKNNVNQTAAIDDHIKIDTIRKFRRWLNQMELNTSQTIIEIGTANTKASRCGGKQREISVPVFLTTVSEIEYPAVATNQTRRMLIQVMNTRFLKIRVRSILLTVTGFCSCSSVTR